MPVHYGSSSHGASAKPSEQRVSIVVGYSWGKCDGELIPMRADGRWISIRDKIRAEMGAVIKIAEAHYAPGDRALNIDLARLRATHGQLLLANIMQRIAAADVLVMDIGTAKSSSFNYNVLLEVGAALACEKHVAGGLFVLKPKGEPIPSDIGGLLVTEYVLDDGCMSICDDLGFRAALRQAIFLAATRKNMIGQRKNAAILVEGDEDESRDTQ